MELGTNVKFHNGLTVRVDWLSFTLKDITVPATAFELLGYDACAFQLLPSGRYGYKSAYTCNAVNGVTVLFDGNEGMGVHVDISGSAFDIVLQKYYENHCENTPFGVAYATDDLMGTVLCNMLKDIMSVGQITRFDLAVDDIGAEYFNMDELQEIFETGKCVTRFRGYKQQKSKTFTGEVTGNTLYLGSRRSACMLRIYDKKLEQNAKLAKTTEPLIEHEWIRWELELKDERATSAANILCSGMPLGTVVIGIISNYIRFIELDSTRRERCSIMEKWERFIAGVTGLSLYQKPDPKTIDDKKNWLWHQVAKSLAAVVKADMGDLDFLFALISRGESQFDKVTNEMIDNYIANMERRCNNG